MGICNVLCCAFQLKKNLYFCSFDIDSKDVLLIPPLVVFFEYQNKINFVNSDWSTEDEVLLCSMGSNNKAFFSPNPLPDAIHCRQICFDVSIRKYNKKRKRRNRIVGDLQKRKIFSEVL